MKCWRRPFPSYVGWEAELRALFGAYVAAKQKQNVRDYDDLLLYWAQMMRAPLLAQRTGPSMNGLVIDFIERGIRQGTATAPCCSPISSPALSTLIKRQIGVKIVRGKQKPRRLSVDRPARESVSRRRP
jgi:hypothetical protein